MFRTVPVSIISSFSLYTHQWYMSYSLRAGSGRNVLILQRNCPKYVEFYSKNKFEKLVYLVGFIKRIYHDARQRQIQNIHTIAKSNKTFLLSNYNLNVIKSFITATCFGSSYRTIFRLSPKSVIYD